MATVYVDAVLGNDATGSRGNSLLPFLTCLAAQAVALSGDTVEVRTGTYAAHSLGKNGVNWNFLSGSAITVTSAAAGSPGDLRYIFTDAPSGTPTAMTYTVSGEVDIEHTDVTVGAQIGFAYTSHASSVMNIAIKSASMPLSGSGEDFAAVGFSCTAGSQTVTISNDVDMEFDSCFICTGGTQVTSVRDVSATYIAIATNSGGDQTISMRDGVTSDGGEGFICESGTQIVTCRNVTSPADTGVICNGGTQSVTTTGIVTASHALNGCVLLADAVGASLTLAGNFSTETATLAVIKINGSSHSPALTLDHVNLTAPASATECMHAVAGTPTVTCISSFANKAADSDIIIVGSLTVGTFKSVFASGCNSIIQG